MNTKWKAVVAFVAAVATAIATAVGNGSIDGLSTREWIGVALIVLGGTALTQLVENVLGAYMGAIKSIIGGVTAFLTALDVGYQNDGVISQGEFLTAVGALFVALSVVYQVTGSDDGNDRPTLRRADAAR